MQHEPTISPAIQKNVKEFLLKHPSIAAIADLEASINEKENEIIDMQAKLIVLKKRRPEVILEYRKSIVWCVEIDADNPEYFLKNKEGLVKCVEYKHKIKLTPRQNSSFGGVLSGMYKDKIIGRTQIDGPFYYGLPKFFKRDKEGYLSTLKSEYEKDLPKLKQVNI